MAPSPVTHIPFRPDILKCTTQTIDSNLHRNSPFITVIVGTPGKETADRESMAFLIKVVKKAGGITKKRDLDKLEFLLPPHTIAVGVALPNFKIDSKVHEFSPVLERADIGFLSFQKLSDNLQITYYNESGTDFLAGIWYYLIQKGKKNWVKEDGFILSYTLGTLEPFPLQDRGNDQRVQFGRFCKRVQRRVLVDRSHGFNLHCECSYSGMKYKPINCSDCKVEIRRSTSPHELDVEFVNRILGKILIYMRQSPTVLVYDNTTGSLLDASKWPKADHLKVFLEKNPNVNVHINSAVMAYIVLDGEMDNRIGGNPDLTGVVKVDNLIDIRTPRDLPSTSTDQFEPFEPAMEATLRKLEHWGLSNIDLSQPCCSEEAEETSDGPNELVTDC